MAYPSLFEQLDSALGAAFRLERELGGGGMSRVFLAEDRALGRRVVVKVLPPELTTELSADRFRREVLIAARLQHPNIVPVLTAGQAGSVMYYAMPFVEGETLRARLLRECARGARGLPLADTVRILRDVARAMGYAHRQGIVHRDIKPENVLLSDDGVLVTDFGIAKAMTDAARLGAGAALTIDGRAIGTVEYMPPEQAVGDPETDHRADIYASGVLAYEMLTGRPPYSGRSAIEVLAAQAVSDPVPVERRRRDVPPTLAKLVTRCLQKRAADRPASADEIIKALDTATNGGAARRAGDGAAVRRRRRVVVAALVTALLAVSTVAVARIPDERRAVLTTLLRRGPPVLRPQRYFVATFENHTGDARFDQWGFLIAGSVAKALVTVPNIEVVDARTRQINERLVGRFPWPMTGDQRKRAAAREAGAGMLIAGSLFLDGDSLRVRTTMSDIATGALAPSVQDVFGPAAHPDTLVARLSNRIAAAIGMSADTGVVARVGDYSDAASPAAYDALRRGMEAYFAHVGLFDKLKQGLQKTTQLLSTDIRDLFKSQGRLVDDSFLTELFETLIKTDMGVEAAQEIVDEICAAFRARVVEMSEVLDHIKAKLKSLLAQPAEPIRFAPSGPTIIMVAGVNGCGKTTSIAKLTNMFQADGRKVVLGAADTFRAAAVEQLTIWAGRFGAEIVTGSAGSDPASVAHRAVAKTIEVGADVCIVDTAGRLQTQQNLMQQLTKIHRVLGKQIPDAPHEILLVLDATTGQNGISQAKHFTEAVRCTGLVLAKLDGTAKGGVVVAIRKQVGLPVKYIGVGEQAEDLALFEADPFVDALFADVG